MSSQAPFNWQAQDAILDWSQAETPVASQFDDVYFSKDDCLGEVDHVFIEGNQLRQRFQSDYYMRSHARKQHFIIAETGFGTGLNFLLTLKLWLASPISRDKQLHFISVEQFPLKMNELEQAHKLWSGLGPLADILRAHYPDTLSGMHHREIDFSAIFSDVLPIKLTLIFDEAQAAFKQLLHNDHALANVQATEAVDAWFLDGFSPSKNPEMWQDSLFQIMAQLSHTAPNHQGTSLATFTAAGFVKRGLKQAGFAMRKGKGFGRKREMLLGSFMGRPELLGALTNSNKNPRSMEFWPIFRSQQILHSPLQRVAIIGAGISGITTAMSLVKSGFTVDLYEANHDAMQEASGNPQAVLFPKLSVHKTALSEFNLLSLNFATAYYKQINSVTEVFRQTGVLQCANTHDKEQLKLLAETLPQLMEFVTPEQASAIAHTEINNHAVFYSKLGFIQSQALKQHCLQQQGIHFHPQHQLTALTPLRENTSDDPQGWQLTFSQQADRSADFVVLCNAQAADHLLPKHSLMIKNIRGQITQVSRDNSYPNKLPDLNTTVCHKGYINPADKTQHKTRYSFGASFDLHNDNHGADTQSDLDNIEKLIQYLPDFSSLAAYTASGPELEWHSRVNFRCTANDYMPVVGPVIDEAENTDRYALYTHNARAFIPHAISCHQGLFVNLGFGSRGYSTAPICAEVIKAYLMASVQPLPKSLIKAIHPGRFFIKQRKQTNA